MKESMVGEESSGGWTSSTNWIATEGSLRNSISFETSDEDAPALTSSGLLLIRPPSDDPSPCEVTILFSKKHEIHRVYIRSTARVYEIYYAADQQNISKEYLCTVRCGAAAREVMPPSSSEGATTECQNGNDGTLEKDEKMARSDSNISVEDGWVEVKLPDSPLQNDQANALSKKVDRNYSANFQIHYEATAEISDASPCLSLTLRLLSLQTKTCVHVEEIYIYADPVDFPNPDPPMGMEGNLGGNPLLAMIVPSLLQLSKSDTSRIQDKYLSADTGVQKHQYCVDKAVGQGSLDMCGIGMQEANCGLMEQDLELSQDETKLKSANTQVESGHKFTNQADPDLEPVQEQTEIKPENVQLGSSQKVADQADQELGPVHKKKEVEPENVQLRSGHEVTEADQELGSVQEQTEVQPESIQLGSSQEATDMDRVPKSVGKENNPAYGCVEKVLDELVSRIRRIETFCSRFEENMMKPLSCIEMRLQRLEQQFDAFVVGTRSSERTPCSRILAPEFPFDESDSENKGSNTSKGVDTVSNDSSLSASDIAASVPESKMCAGLAVKAPEFHNEDDFSLSASAGGASLPESNMCPGLVVKAPKFLNEDEECANTDDTLDSGVKDCPKDKTPLSIDGALASALAAFLTSNTIKSPKSSPNVRGKPHGFSDGNNSDSDSSSVGVSSEGSDKLFSKIDLEKNGCGTSSVVKETNWVDFLSSDDVVVAPVTSLDESDLKDKGCDTSDVARGVAAFDDSSLLADNMGFSVSVPQISGLIVTAPEFPNEEDDFIDCDNTSDSDIEDGLKEQESVPTAGKSTLTLAEFLSSNKAKSSDHNSTLLGATLDLFNGDNHELPASSVEIPCEGVERVGIKSHGNNMIGKVDLEQFFNLLPPDGVLEHGEHVMPRHTGSTEHAVEGSTTNCMNVKDGIEQKDIGVKWYGSNSAEGTAMDEGYFTQTVPNFMGFQPNGGIHSNQHDGSWLDDSDAEEAAHASPSFNKLGRGWTKDCSTDSSFEDKFIKSSVQIDWSDESSTDSVGGSFTVNQHSGQVADNYRSSQAFVDGFSAGIGLNSADFKYEMLPAELKQAFDSVPDYEDQTVDVKFAPAGDWGTGLPLEVLLGGTSDGAVQASTVKNVDDSKCVAAGQQHDLFPSQWEDPSPTIANKLLVEIEDLRVPSETCLWDAELQGPQGSNQQPFSSLI